MTTARQVLSAFVKSKGEGSRGGHIVGHTHDGAPIYAKKQFSAADAKFHEARHVLYSGNHVDDYASSSHHGPRDVHQWVVPLKGGFEARHTIVSYQPQDAPDGRESVHGEWSVHHPSIGAVSGVGLHEDFLRHPEAKDIAIAHKDHALEQHELTGEEMDAEARRHGINPNERRMSGSYRQNMIDAGRGHLIGDRDRNDEPI